MKQTLKKALTVILCSLCVIASGFAATWVAVKPSNAAEEAAGSGAATPTPTFTVIDGKRNSNSSQNYTSLCDGNVNTKYCIDISLSPYAIFAASDMNTVVTGYTLYTANDTDVFPERNPKDWTVYGSNDAINWTAIHTVENDDTLKGTKYVGYDFSFENTTPYLFYKIGFISIHSELGTSTLIQLAEIEFKATTSAVAEIKTEAEFKQLFSNGGQAKLAADIQLGEALSLDKKTVRLDLNGHVVSGKDITIWSATKDCASILILEDGNPSAVHTDASLPAGGVVDNKILFNRTEENYSNLACLYANGGSVTQSVKFDTGYATVGYFGDKTTSFFGEVTGCGVKLNGGLYYGAISSTNSTPFSTNGKKVTFSNGDNVYAIQYANENLKVTCPVTPAAPESGAEFIGWYKKGDGIIYDFSNKITADFTLTALWSKNVGTLAEFKAAVGAGYSVKLTADITLDGSVQVVKDAKYAVLDLNGHVIEGGFGGSNVNFLTLNGSASVTELIIIDSNPAGTHENAKYPQGGYIKCRVQMNNCNNSYPNNKYARVFANGGTIGEMYANSSAGEIYSKSVTPSVIENVIISGGIVVKGGTFYKVVKEPSADRKITFKDGDGVFAIVATHATSIAEPARKPVKEGFEFIGWYNGENKYDFSAQVNAPITLTAKWRDVAAPVISGVDENSVYCSDSVEITVKDYSLAWVKVNGKTVSLTDDKFTLDMSDNLDKVIVALDNAGNKTQITVKHGHAFGEWIDEVGATCTADGVKAHKVCSVCNRNFDEKGNEIDLTIPAHHTFDGENDETCNVAGCDYKRLLSLDITSSGYGLDGKIGDFKMQTADENKLKVNDLVIITDIEKFMGTLGRDPSCYIDGESSAYFMPDKDYYVFLTIECDSSYDLSYLTKKSVKTSGVTSTVYLIDFDVSEIFLIYKMPVLGGKSAIKGMPELGYSVSGYTAGEAVKKLAFTPAATNSVAATVGVTVSKFTDAGITGVTDDEVFDKNTAYMVTLKIAAPENYCFFGFTKDKISIGGVYIEDVTVSSGGSFIEVYFYMPSLEENHKHTSSGWMMDETAHFKTCGTCYATVDYAAHVYDNDFDINCNVCGYERTINLTQAEFILSGFAAKSKAAGVVVTTATVGMNFGSVSYGFSGYYLSLSATSNDWQPIQPDETGVLVPNKQYYLFVTLEALASNYTSEGLKAENISLKIGTATVKAKLIEDINYYDRFAIFELPLLSGTDDSIAIESVKIKIDGYVKDQTVGDVTVKLDGEHAGVKSVESKFAIFLNQGYLDDDHVLTDSNTYVAKIVLIANDGYNFYGMLESAVTVTVGGEEAVILSFYVSTGGGSVVIDLKFNRLVGEHAHEWLDYYADYEGYHYTVCEKCGVVGERSEHVYESGHDWCSDCGFIEPITIDRINFTMEGYEYLGAANDVIINSDCAGVIVNAFFSDEIDGYNFVWSFDANVEYYLRLDVYLLADYVISDSIDLKNVTLAGVGNAISVEIPYYGYYSFTFELPEFEAPHVHGYGEWIEEVFATCVTDGVKGHKDCTICGKHFDAQNNEISDLSIKARHNFGEWIEEVAATTENEGVKAHKDCLDCHKHFDEKGNEIADLTIAKLPEPNNGLSGGAIAGIAAGGVAVAGAGGFSVMWFVVKKRSFADLIAAIKGIFKK